MLFKNLVFLVTLCFVTTAFAQQSAKPVSIIFDSDIGPDYDDVGAIAMLHAFADKGEAKILATMASTKIRGRSRCFKCVQYLF